MNIPKKTWEDWKDSNEFSLGITNGKLDVVSNPNWYGSSLNKGDNVYDASVIEIIDVDISGMFKSFHATTYIEVMWHGKT